MRLRSLLLVCIVCTACSGSTSNNDCFKEYWNGEVGTCLPQGWRVLDDQTMRQRGVPDDAIIAFQSEESVSGQFLTVTVTKEQLAQALDAAIYSQANVRLVSSLPRYELIDSTGANVDGQTVDLHIFTAQPVADEPPRRFYQISTVANNIGYSITGTSPVSVDDDTERQMISIVQLVTFEEGEVVDE